MAEPEVERRWRFTWLDLLVVAGVLGLIVAVIMPAISRALEAARRTSCSGFLKQIGLGIQNFEDIRGEICPSYLTDDDSRAAQPRGYPSWPVLLLPFMEQQELAALVDLSVPLDEKAAPPADHSRLRQTTLLTFQCYSRRDGWSKSVQGVGHWTGPYAVGDYLCVSLAEAVPGKVDRNQPRTWDGAMMVSRTSEGLQPGEFRSMTTFADIVDGVSNTVLLGEKAVREGHLGGNTADPSSNVLPSEQDGPYYHGRGGDPADLQMPGPMAYWSRRLAPLRSTERLFPFDQRNEDPQNRFGSWHPGVTLFLLGDGSVREVNNATSSVVLQRLGCRNDGQLFDLP